MFVIDDNKGKFRWIAQSNDGSWKDESKIFDSQKDCFDDMLHNAIIKIKWNTTWEDILYDTTVTKTCDGIFSSTFPIGYELKINVDTISHESYSGIYTWKIEKVKDI